MNPLARRAGRQATEFHTRSRIPKANPIIEAARGEDFAIGRIRATHNRIAAVAEPLCTQARPNALRQRITVKIPAWLLGEDLTRGQQQQHQRRRSARHGFDPAFFLVPKLRRGNGSADALRPESRIEERCNGRSHAGAWERGLLASLAVPFWRIAKIAQSFTRKKWRVDHGGRKVD
jgi:hypothetical protein